MKACIEDLRKLKLPESFDFKLVDGQPVALIRNKAAEASVSLYGGQVLSWRQRGAEDVFWLSKNFSIEEGKSIRGGIPLCWPWFGACPGNPKGFGHGLARLSFWDFESGADIGSECTELILRLKPESLAQTFGNARFELRLIVRVGRSFEATMETRNVGAEPFSFSEAFHSYFRVGDVSQCKVSGLEDGKYFDKSDGKEKTQKGDIKFFERVDRIYHASSSATLEDASLGRKIEVKNEGGSSIVVWNPGEGVERNFPGFAPNDDKTFVCVEAAQPESLTLKPSCASSFKTRIEVHR